MSEQSNSESTGAERNHWPWLIGVLALCFFLAGTGRASAQLITSAGQNFLFLDISGAQTQIDVDHTTSWYITVASGKSFTLYGGDFAMKEGSGAVANVTLTVYSIGAGGVRTALASATKTSADFGSSFSCTGSSTACTVFAFSSGQTLTAGSYYVALTSPASTAGSVQYFIKGVSNPTIQDGVTILPTSTATASPAPATSNLTLGKLATASVSAGSTITYTIKLGNDGGAPSGTSATVKDQLPAGVTATAVTSGTGVSSVSCGSLPSSAAALLTCSTTLSSALASGSAPSATFTITATAPASAGTITNYASVDPAGTASPATPGSGCTTTSCGNASTTVTASANLTLSKAATSSVSTGGAITYTINLGNSGGVTSGTSATVKDQLPAGVIATAVSLGTGVSSVSCGSLPSSAAALLTCTATLSSGLAAGAANGAAAFTITATAPGSAGSITNYASVDPSGGSSPATPGSGCATTSCGSASTTVTAPTNFTLSKSASSSVVTGGAMTYTLGLGNSGTGTSLTSATVADQLPTGVKVTAATPGTGVSSVSCTNIGTASALVTCTVTLSSGLASSAANGAATFTLTATAPGSTGSITNYASVDPSGGTSPATPGAGCGTTSCSSASTTVIAATNFTLSKSAAGTAITSGAITYTINLGNSGGSTSGTSLTVADQLPTGSTATLATPGSGVSSVTCAPLNTASALVTCTVTLSSGLASGAANGAAKFTLATTAPSSAGSITNYASVDATGGASPATPGASCATTSCGSASTTVQTAPDLTVTSTHVGSFAQSGTGSYTVTATNGGGSSTTATVTVVDTLPAGLTPTAASGTGWSCGIASLVVTCTRSDALSASSSYPAITVTVSVASSAGTPLSNSVAVSGGGETNTTNDTATDSTTITSPADLTLALSHTGNFTQGQVGATYTLTATNGGGGSTSGTVTVVDTLPTGLTPTAGSGTGWTCSISGQTVTCTRSDALAAAASYAPITVTVTVASNASTSVTNSAAVSGGGEGNTANDSATDPTTIVATADFATAMSRSGSFLPGQTGTYSVTISNVGGGASSGLATVTQTLPAGITATSATGTGWACTIAGQTVTCTRSDALASGSSYPVISVATSVASTVTAALSSTATVSNAGDINSANNAATTTTPAPPDLTIIGSHTGSFSQGQIGATYSLTVTNSGSSTTSGTVTVTDTLPGGLTPTAASGTGWSCGIAGQVVTCTRSDALGGAASYPPIGVTVTVASNASTPLVNAVTVAGGSEGDTTNDSSNDSTTISPQISDLTVALSHSGTLSQGQTGVTYTGLVTNSGGGPTSGAVTFTATFDPALPITSANGTGWSCSISGQTVTCTRSDALAGGASFPVISIIVSVSSTAGTPLANTATVSGGGETNTSNDSSSDPTTVAQPKADLVVAVSHSGTLTQGDTGVGFTATIANAGPAPTSGAISLSVTLPAGVVPTAASGSGWSCSISGQTVSCTRADSTGPNGGFPQVAITANVAADAPASGTATASVSGGGETNTANDSASDTVTIVARNTLSARLVTTVSHVGDPVAGQPLVYSIVVSNAGSGASTGPVTVTDILPPGVTPQTASGSGWTCSISGQVVTCTRPDSLPAGSAFPTITITTLVSTTATGTLVDTVSVNGSGTSTTTTDSAPVVAVNVAVLQPNLTVTNNTFNIGLTGGYTVDVKNTGSGPSSGPVTVTLNMTGGVTLSSASGAGWSCTVAASTVTCTRSDPLAAGASYPTLTLLLTVTATQPQTTTITTTVSGGGMTSPKASTITVPIGFPDSDLTPHITHTGVMARLQTDAAFAVDVQNLGPSPSIGLVRLALTIPSGFRPVSATGAGWSCTIQTGGVECTRSDNLAVNSTYPIDLRIAIDGNAADGLVVTATVTCDHDPILTNNTASDTVHVVTFSTADFKVDKTVDRPVLKIGEAAQFQLKVKNVSEAQLDDVKLTDSLPKGFTFVNGTARIVLPAKNANAAASVARTFSTKPPVLGTAASVPATIAGDVVTPVSANGSLAFAVGSMRGLDEVTITYYTIVGVDAKPGTQLTRVVGTFQSPLGERVSAAPVEVAVTVTPTAFASEQVIVGRVFDDVNDNGQFDNGDRGLAGVRVILPTGQSAITDKNGLYNLPALAAGTTTITVDPATVPAGYTMRRSNLPSESGWSRLLRTPLGGGALLRQNFALVRSAGAAVVQSDAHVETTPTISEPVRDGTGVANWPPDAMTHRTPVIGRLEIQADRPEMDAGGRDRAFVTIRAFDPSGAPLKSGSVTLATTAGQWLLADRPAGDEASRAAAQIDPTAQPSSAKTNAPSAMDYCRRDGSAVELPVELQTGSAIIHDGVARVCLQSDVAPSTAHLRATADDGSGIEAKTDVRFIVARSAPVLAAVGEIAVGRGEAAMADTAATGDVHGVGALFFQGAFAHESQITFAATTADSINRAAGTDRRFGLDPTDRVYPVFGDSSTRQELAASNSRVYARLDVKRSSVLFGDLRGDVARSGRSGLLDVARSLTGTEVHLERNANQWLTVQAARPETAFTREVFAGTAAGFLRLAQGPILIGSDTLTLEVRDRRRPDLVRDREPLVRGVDYILDPLAGIIYFNRPLPLFDDALNIVQVVATYEYQTTGLHNSVYVARGQQDIKAIGLSMRATALQQTMTSGSDIFVGGVEADEQLPNHGHLHVDVPVSHGVNATGTSSSQTGTALRAEFDQPIGLRRATIRARLARTDNVFANPYGSPVVPGSTVGSGGIELQATATSRIRLTATGESTHSTAADATRTTVSAEWAQKVGPKLELTGIFDDRQLDDTRANRKIDSKLVTGVVDWRPSDRAQATIRREQNLDTADPTYPDQTVASGRYRVTSGTQLFATERWSDAPIIPITGVGAGGLFTPLSTRETAIGVESRLQRFTTVTTRYQIDDGLNGTDGFAVLGVMTRVPVHGPWSVDGGLDHAVRIEGTDSGYTSATGGISFAPETWRASLHYQFRDGFQSQHLLSAGIAGQLGPTVTALAHYRTADYFIATEKQTRVDALAAIAVRPKATDRAGLLFSWNYGDDLSPLLAVNQQTGHRVSRVSADGYLQPATRLELYSRVALLRTELGDLGAASTYLWQGRAQVKVFARVDVAGEARWVDELASDATGRLIGAAELGFWLSRDLRVAGGYTTRPWAASGPTLETSTGRGGFYFVLTSRLSSLFDLFTAKTPAAAATAVAR